MARPIACDRPWPDYPNLDLPKRQRQQLERFFVDVGSLAHDRVDVEGWDNGAKAERIIDRAIQAYTRREPKER